MKIKDTDDALKFFKEASMTHAEATENGDYKTANKSYDRIEKAVTFLKSKNETHRLIEYFFDPSVGVRLWSAYYLLPTNTKKACDVLEEIAKGTDIHSLTAKTTVSEWKKGNLKF
jgi:hypothetical protein